MIFKNLAAVLAVTTAAVLASAGLTAHTANAADITIGNITTNCSWGSCSHYYSRSATEAMYNYIDRNSWQTGAGATALCGAIGRASGPAGLVTGPVCEVNAIWIMEEIKRAATQHPPNGACFKITKAHHPGALPYFSTNNGKFCKD